MTSVKEKVDSSVFSSLRGSVHDAIYTSIYDSVEYSALSYPWDSIAKPVYRSVRSSVHRLITSKLKEYDFE